MKIAGTHSAVEPRHQPAAVERRHRAQERQDGQRADERDDARQDQDFDRIEAHGAQRVDLLAHLHGAELGRVGAAGAAGRHDGHDQHADLAQHQDADHVDHIGVGAELAEVENALLGDDAADQERDQHHDRHRLPADAEQVIDRGGQSEAARIADDASQRDGEFAEHVEKCLGIRCQLGGCAAHAVERRPQSVRMFRRRALLQIDAADRIDQAAIMRRQSDELRVRLGKIGTAAAAVPATMPPAYRAPPTPAMSIEMPFAFAACGAAASTSCSSACECAAVHAPAGASRSRSAVIVLLRSGAGSSFPLR